jgi:hypothetical protein
MHRLVWMLQRRAPGSPVGNVMIEMLKEESGV